VATKEVSWTIEMMACKAPFGLLFYSPPVSLRNKLISPKRLSLSTVVTATAIDISVSRLDSDGGGCGSALKYVG
jgi:hypothetical protein